MEDGSKLFQEMPCFNHVYSKFDGRALIKMVMHAQSGGNIEVMGSLQGRVQGNSLVIVDSFELPVQGFICVDRDGNQSFCSE